MSINTTTGRQYDYFKNLIVPNSCYFIVRLDGNCFSGLTEKNFKFPFDEKFYQGMKHGVIELMNNIPDIYKAHTHSDEVSIYFKKESDWFNRRIEKIISITSGIMSVAFSQKTGVTAHFDSRVLITPTEEDIEKYEKDRVDNAFRGCVNSYSFYTLSNLFGKTRATQMLKDISMKDRIKVLLDEYTINVLTVPNWQRLGAFFQYKEVDKEGYNPATKQKVMTKRNIIQVEE